MRGTDMRQTIMLMAACAALLASCTNEVGEGLGVDTPIRVTASVEGIMTTRADNTTESLSTFGLSIKDGTGYTGNYAGENILAEKDNGTWTLSKTVLYQGSGQSYYAYAPYKEGHTGESLTFTVDADQATNDLQGSDLLHAWGSVTSANLDITLAHKLSKLTVTVKKKGETSPIEVGDVTLRGTVPTATLDLTSGDVAASDAATSEITMWKSSKGIYECILVPQAAKAFGVSFTYGGDTYLWESSSYTFEGGNAYTLALTFDGKVSAGEVTVSEWGEPENNLGEGTATEKDYTTDANGNYTVYTAEGLLKWAAAANQMVSLDGINCTLAADIDMGQTKWKGLIYYGTFDGNGHTITGLNECFITDNNGTVKNLTLVNPEILSSGFSAGAVAGTNYGIIDNCHVVGGSVVGTGQYSGGIAVYNKQNGTIRACSTSTTVTLTYEGTGIKSSGGIVGENGGTILACYATGSITGTASSKGAISGERTIGEHIACYWSGDTEKGVGSGSADGTTKVEGSVTWETAMNTMNTALDGSGYRWIENTGENKEDRPLIITNE